MMRFDCGRRSPKRNGLNDIGVECALEQKLNLSASRLLQRVINAMRFGFKYFNKCVSNEFSLPFRVSDLFIYIGTLAM